MTCFMYGSFCQVLTKNALLIPFILHQENVSLERVNSLQHKTPSNIDAGFNIYGDINFKSHSPPKTKPDPKGIWSPRPGLMWHVGLGHRKCPTEEDGGTNIDRKQMCVFCCVCVMTHRNATLRAKGLHS